MCARREALYARDIPKFMKALKSFFTDIPYDMTDRQNEQMWQTIVYVVLRSIGISFSAEKRTIVEDLVEELCKKGTNAVTKREALNGTP